MSLKVIYIVLILFKCFTSVANECQSLSFQNFAYKNKDVCRKNGKNIWTEKGQLLGHDKSNMFAHHPESLHNGLDDEYLEYQAIAQLHSLIDDDKDGDLDPYESKEFLEQDLQRQASISSDYHHLNALVSKEELWKYWCLSEVHNWTEKQVLKWLQLSVELPQYTDEFENLHVTGRMLPRLASSSHNHLYALLNVKNLLHRQKISLKATDLVLFGPTNVQHRYFSDNVFIISLLLVAISCFVASQQSKQSKQQLSSLSCQLSLLQDVQRNLDVFQAQLEESHKRRREEEEARDELKKKLQKKKRIFKIESFDSDDNEDDSKNDNHRRSTQFDDDNDETITNLPNNNEEDDDVNNDDYGKRRFIQLREQLREETFKLFEAERKLEERRKQSTTPELQQWFQMTYEIENKYWREKKASIEKNLDTAIKKCEKLKRQRFKMLSSIKEEDVADAFAREMEGLRREAYERTDRWRHIEELTSLNITTNPGLNYLNTLLRNNVAEKMSSKNLFNSPVNIEDMKSNLLKAGMQLCAIGVNQSFANGKEGSYRYIPASSSTILPSSSFLSIPSFQLQPKMQPTISPHVQQTIQQHPLMNHNVHPCVVYETPLVGSSISNSKPSQSSFSSFEVASNHSSFSISSKDSSFIAAMPTSHNIYKPPYNLNTPTYDPLMTNRLVNTFTSLNTNLTSNNNTRMLLSHSKTLSNILNNNYKSDFTTRSNGELNDKKKNESTLKKNVKKEDVGRITKRDDASKSVANNDVLSKKIESNDENEDGDDEKKEKNEKNASDKKESKRKKKNKLKEFFKKK